MTSEPGPLRMVKLIVVPAGAFAKPVPVLMFTWPVKRAARPSALVAVAGVIWMFASTQVFTAFGASPT